MTPDQLVNANSVVLVSGGARGITAQCVIKLAERARCRFILLGRSSVEGEEPEALKTCREEAEIKQALMQDLKAKGEKPTLQKVQRLYHSLISRREIKETLEAVRLAGGYAEYYSVDITDREKMQEALAEPVQRLGAITGIIHGAGNLADKLIEKKSVSDYDHVFAAKIDGLENILASVPVSQLNFLVLFSSIVGFYGNVGQADYAMANEILNKTAHLIKRNHPACHVISVGWGPWDSGMVTPELKKTFEDNRVRVIPSQAGADILVDELLPSAHSVTQVVVGDAPPRPPEEAKPDLRHYEIRRKLTLDANPFLNDHRIGQHPVLPATCAATWVASSCEQLYPNHTFHLIENYKVLKGIVFDDNLASEYVLDLQEISKSETGDVEMEALIWSLNSKGKRIYNYSLRLTLMKNTPDAPLSETIFAPDAPTRAQLIGKSLYQDGTLFHGPAFQGVDCVMDLSQKKLTMQVILPRVADKIQGQFPVQTGNPFVYDAVVQSLLIWSQNYYHAPCLPSYMERLEHYKAIPFGEPVHVSLEIQSQSETAVVGDLRVQAPDGQTYVRIMGLQGTISPRLNNVIGQRAAQ